MATEKTSWEVELDEDVSPAARKAETALARLQRQIQRFSSASMSRGMAALGSVRDKIGLTTARATATTAAMRRNRAGKLIDSRGKFVSEKPVVAAPEPSVGRKALDFTRSKMGGAGNAIASYYDRGKKSILGATNAVKGFYKRHKEGIDKTFEKASTVVGGVAVTALAIGAGILYATTKMVDFGQKSRAAFGMLLGDSDKGNAAFRESREIAKELGMDIADVTGSYQRFLSMGFDEDESQALIKMGADMTALGASTEKVRSVLDAMGKIQATGTLQGDELMMLAEAGINIGSIYDRLGEQFGKTRGQIVKMKEAGKISSRDAIDAIKATVLATTKQTEFGAARKVVISSTLGGGWDKMKAEFRDKMIGIADAASPYLVKALGAVNRKISKVLNGPDGEKISGGIVRAIEWVMGAVEKAIPWVDEFMRSFSEGMGEVLGPMWEIGQGITSSFGGDKTETIRMMGKAIGQLVGVGLAAAAVFGGEVLAAIVAVSKAVNVLVASLRWVVDNIGSFIFSFSDAYANQQAIKDAVQRAGGLANYQTYQADHGYNDMSGQVRSLKPGAAAPNVNQTANINVTAEAPKGGSREDGQAWGEGAANGMRRGQMRFFESVNASRGT